MAGDVEITNQWIAQKSINKQIRTFEVIKFSKYLGVYVCLFPKWQGVSNRKVKLQ